MVTIFFLKTCVCLAQEGLNYLRSENELADVTFKQMQYAECSNHCINIVDYYKKNKKTYLKNYEATLIVFNACKSLGEISDFPDLTEKDRISYLCEAVYIVETNRKWVSTYDNKYDIILLYQNYIGLLIDNNPGYDVSDLITKMIDFGKTYCKNDINDILMAAASFNSLSQKFDD
ncbi:MAG: hypothetical protein LUC91_10630, partial [Prevotella sp.]|nr:hypothetical protein [Prevotella sp.]